MIVLTILFAALSGLCGWAALQGDRIPERAVMPLWRGSFLALALTWAGFLAWLLS